MGLWDYLKNREERRLQEDRYILCLDGGGIRGIIPATILNKIEQKIRSLGDDRPLYSHFDLVAGTSTGGLIALALTAPNSGGSLLPQQQAPIANTPTSRKKHPRKGFDNIYPGPDLKSIVDIYLQYGEVIFPKNPALFQLNLIGQLFSQKYDDTSFVKFLSELFGDLRMHDALVPTMVVTYDCENDRPYIISSYERGDIPMRLAARATSAAPTYFAPTTITDENSGEQVTLIDGGVVANNPVLYAYMEARKLYPEAKRFHVLSISTASTPSRIKTDKMGSGVIGWFDPVKGAPLHRVYAASQMHTSNDIAASIGDMEYVRIHGDIGKKIRLDDTQPAALTLLTNAADRIYAENEEAIASFCTPLIDRPSFSSRRPHPQTALSTLLSENSSANQPSLPVVKRKTGLTFRKPTDKRTNDQL